MHALQGKAVSQITKQTKPNPIINNMKLHSSKMRLSQVIQKKGLFDLLHFKKKGKNQSGMCRASNRNTMSLPCEVEPREYLGKAGDAGSAVEFPSFSREGGALGCLGVLQKCPWESKFGCGPSFLGSPCALSAVKVQGLRGCSLFNQHFQTQDPRTLSPSGHL